MGVARFGQSQRPGDGDLARRREQQVVAAHDDVDAGGGVVDDDGEVVCGDTVVAAQHDVPRRPFDGSGDDVVEGDGIALGAEAHGRRPLGPPSRCADGR